MNALARFTLFAVTLAFACVLPGVASAQWRSTGVPVYTAVTGEGNAVSAPDGAGGAFVVWEDLRTNATTSTDLYAQHMLPSGVPDPAWPVNGVAVCTAAGIQYSISIISDGSGGAFVSWLDHRNGASYQPYGHHLTSTGVDAAWPLNGRQLLTSASGVGVDVQMVRDASTGMFALVSVLATGTNFVVQHVLGTGVIDANFSANGVVIGNSTTANYVRGTIVRDNAGGAIVLWANGAVGAVAIRMLTNGTKDPAWPAAGRNLITPIVAGSANIVATSDQAGGAIAAWDQNGAQGREIYAQHVAVDGVVDVNWPATGLLVCSAPNSQQSPQIASDGGTVEHGAIIAWQDYRNGVDSDVYVQHVRGRGDVEWTANGVAVSTAVGYQTLLGVVPGTFESALLLWDDVSSLVYGLYAQHVLANGTVDPAWPASGAAIEPFYGSYSTRAYSSDGAGGILVPWAEARVSPGGSSHGGIYLRKLPSDATHRITPTIGAGGTAYLFTPDSLTMPTASVPYLDVTAAERTEFRFVPGGANAIAGVTVNLASQGVPPNITLSNVTTNTALGVTFSSALWNVDLSTPGVSYSPAGWPMTFADSTVATLLPTLWPSDDATWRLAHWDPVSSRYVFASDSLLKLEAGSGYWLATMTPRLISVTGHPITAASVSLPLAGGVASGWNQVANPYRFPIADSALRVVVGANTFGFTAVGNSAVEHAIYDYSGSGYVAVHTLQPNRSYWVHKMIDGAVSLKFPNLSSTGPAPALPGLPDGAEWAVGVVARQGATATAPVMLGAGAASRDVATPLRRESPPPSPQGGLALNAGEPGEARVRQISDLVPNGAPAQWTLELAGAEAPGEVQLEIAGYALPAGLRLWLSDPAAGWTREVHAGETVTLAAFASARRLTLEANFGAPASGEAAALAMSAYPNPFRGAIGLRAALPASADVRVQILDLQGRLVCTLDRRMAPTGESVLLWDGRSSNGEAVRPGIYLARWQAGVATGALRLVKIE